MAMFKKAEPLNPRERVAPPPRGVTGDAAISIIGLGMRVIGDVTTEGIVRVEGQVKGTIRAGKSIILGQAGVIDGNISTDDAVIGGTVTGYIVANNRLELQSTCTVNGEIRTRAEHLKLEEGARFTGQVHMIVDEPSAPQKLPIQPTAQPIKSSGVEGPSRTEGIGGTSISTRDFVAASGSVVPEITESAADVGDQKIKKGAASEATT